MKRALGILLILSLWACGGSSSDGNKDVASPADTTPDTAEADTTESDVPATADGTVADGTDPEPDDVTDPSDTPGPMDAAPPTPDTATDATSPPSDDVELPIDNCWMPDDGGATMDCAAICANTLQCDPDDECELMCPLTSKYISETVGTALTACMTQPCTAFEDTDFFQTCAQQITSEASIPGVLEGMALCQAGQDLLAQCPTMDPNLPQVYKMTCGLMVPLFSAQAQEKIAACYTDPCSAVDCLKEANCILGGMLSDYEQNPGPGPGPPPDMCWVPAKPAGGYNLDCDAYCSKMTGCSPMPAGECAMQCSMTAPYFNADAGPLVDACLADISCTEETAFSLLPQCIQQVATLPSSALPVPDGNLEAADALLAIMDKCTAEQSPPFLFESLYSLSMVTTAETMAHLQSSCGTASCEQMMECLFQDNCLFATIWAGYAFFTPPSDIPK